MLDVFLDALFDSLKVFAIAFIIFILLSFIENFLAKKLSKSKKSGPLIGSMLGLIPQCGVSVVASDLYIKKTITIGTLVAVFISCSDESLPILLSNNEKWYMAFLLFAVKFVAGFVTGILLDYFYTKHHKDNEKFEDVPYDKDIHIGCCHHEIDDKKENKWHKHLVHPLVHSLKIFIYVFVINMIFGIIIYYVGEDNIINFVNTNRYLSPLFTTLIGFIPNCASSVVITELYIENAIPFAALVSGLTVNAGLGMVYLFKDKNGVKSLGLIIAVLFFVSLILGYSLIWFSF